jgi:excinuclease UvrABC nuclease subunit
MYRTGRAAALRARLTSYLHITKSSLESALIVNQIQGYYLVFRTARERR